MHRRADIRDDSVQVGGVEQVLVAQTLDQSPIPLAALAQLAGSLFDAPLQRERQQLVVQFDLHALGDVAADVHARVPPWRSIRRTVTSKLRARPTASRIWHSMLAISPRCSSKSGSNKSLGRR